MDDRAYENCPNCVESVLARRREGYMSALPNSCCNSLEGELG